MLLEQLGLPTIHSCSKDLLPGTARPPGLWGTHPVASSIKGTLDSKPGGFRPSRTFFVKCLATLNPESVCFLSNFGFKKKKNVWVQCKSFSCPLWKLPSHPETGQVPVCFSVNKQCVQGVEVNRCRQRAGFTVREGLCVPREE